MAGKTIGKSMNYGYAGNYSRTPDDIVASRLLAATSAAIPFGAPVELASDNTYKAISGTTVAAAVAGIALRIVKQAISYDDQNVTNYNPGEYMSVLERGAATVICHGTPTAGGKVYLRVALNESKPNAKIGDLECEADSTKTVELTNMRWTNGYKDVNNIAELTILTRILP